MNKYYKNMKVIRLFIFPYTDINFASNQRRTGPIKVYRRRILWSYIKEHSEEQSLFF